MYAKTVDVALFENDRRVNIFLTWPFTSEEWKPALRSVVALYDAGDVVARYTLNRDGICELSCFYGENERHVAGLFAGWLISSAALMLDWLDRVRQKGGYSDQEYAFVPTIVAHNNAVLADYASHNFSGPGLWKTRRA